MKGLLVEDNRGDVNLIQLALESVATDVELQVVDDGVKALEFLQRRDKSLDCPRPDFILLDLNLPRMTGFEVISRLKQDPELRRIPVIALTSSRAASDVSHAYDLQVAAYFVKPLTGFQEVVEVIIRFLRAAQLPGPEHGQHFLGADVIGRAEGPYGAVTAGAESLQLRPRELVAIVQGSLDPIISTTLDGTITTWNQAAQKLYGYTSQETVGQNIRLIVPEEGAGELESVLSTVGRGEGGRHFETVRVGREGRKVHISSSASPIRDHHGTVVGISLISRDVTERRQLEEKFRIAVECAPSAMVMVDAAGTIILVNAETERLFGYRRDELIGEAVELLVPKRFRAQHPDLRAGFITHPEARAMGAGRELFGLRKDGSEFPVEIGLTPIKTTQGALVLSAIVDITERKRAEEALAQQTRELARSNAHLEQFAYVASHDLQEPLRTVASFTKLLASRYADKLDDEGKTFIRFAREGAIRMQNLIEALLAYSRVGTRAGELTAVDAGSALRQALVNLRAGIEEAAAEVVCGDLPSVRADAAQLVALFQNLVGNAIKFRGAKRPRVEIAARRGESEWVFSVADNGIGIESRFFDRIFQVFQRLHGQEEYPGTGIGLAICKRVVERMGGRIWVESTPGSGTTFSFSVPIQVQEAPAPSLGDAG